MGLRLVLQPRPLCPALYAISVRRLGTLPAASFRFHLTMDTLAVRLTLPTTKRVMDFHHQAIAHGGRTSKSRLSVRDKRLLKQNGSNRLRFPDSHLTAHENNTDTHHRVRRHHHGSKSKPVHEKRSFPEYPITKTRL